MSARFAGIARFVVYLGPVLPLGTLVLAVVHQGFAVTRITLISVLVILGLVALYQRSLRVLFILSICGVLAVTSFSSSARGPTIPRSGWVQFEVREAATPGKNCQVLVRSPGDFAVPVVLQLHPNDCDWRDGDQIWIPARTWHRARDRWTQMASDIRPKNLRVYSELAFGQTCSAHLFWGWIANWRWKAFVWSRRSDGMRLAVASVSGMTSSLSTRQRQDIRDAGLGHLTAVSGLHVGLFGQTLAWIVQKLWMAIRLLFSTNSRVLRRGRGGWVAKLDPSFWTQILATIPVLAFVAASGFAPSAVRASVLWLACRMGAVFGVHLHVLSVLGWVAWLLLVVEPQWISEPGFQLSVVATAWLLTAPNEKSGMWATSWRLTWGLSILTLVHFDAAPIIAPLANVIAIPVFTFWVLPWSLVAFLGALFADFIFYPWVGDWASACLDLAGCGGELILEIARCFRNAPRGSVPVWGFLSSFAFAVDCAWKSSHECQGRAHWVRNILPSRWLCTLIAMYCAWKTFL